MENKKFKNGDVVCLNSATYIKMTVVDDADEDNLQVKWFDDSHKMHSDSFPSEALQFWKEEEKRDEVANRDG